MTTNSKDLDRVLYVGPFDSYIQAGIVHTSVSRFQALRDLGLRMTAFDSSGHLGRVLWRRRVNRRLYLGRPVRDVNRALVWAAQEQRPDVLWVDKGYWIYPQTLAKLKKHCGYLVHYNTDDIFAPGEYGWLHRLGLRHYDLYVTTNRQNVVEIPKRYGVRSLRAGMGFDEAVHCYRPAAGSKGAGVVFVGHWEPHSEALLGNLARAGCPAKVWGARWRHASNPALRSATVLDGARYTATIADAAIALCLLSRNNRNESTGRSFEIPAIGTFMLAERTIEHEYLYGDGIGAALFSGPEELLERIRYYLDHAGERESIASAGHERCMALGLTWREHMQREWAMVGRILQAGVDLIAGPEFDAPFWPGFRLGGLPGRDRGRAAA